MNVTQGMDTQHKTGIIEREEETSNPLGTGGLSFIQHAPVTGKFTTIGEASSASEQSDAEYFQAIVDIKAPEILIQPEIAEAKRQFVADCRKMFMEANLSSSSEINILIQIFSSFANSAPMDTKNQTFKEDLEKYFINSKLMIQTFVEYLHLVKGIDRHKLKALLANFCLIYKTTFKSYFQSETVISKDLLTITNFFLPELIASLKDKNNVEQFSDDFVNLLSTMIAKREVDFDFLLEDDDFVGIVGNFVKTHLNINLKDFIKSLKSIYTYSQDFWNEQQISEFLNIIKYLNSPEYITRSLDSFINELSRIIRLNYLTTINPSLSPSIDKVQDDFSFEIKNIHNESRRSIYPSIEAAKVAVDTREVDYTITREKMMQFHLKVYSDIQRGGAAEGRKPRTVQEVLNAIMRNEFLQIEEPYELINYFFRLFEDNILEFEETVFNETGKTIPDRVISDLCFAWIKEIKEWFNTSANLVTPRKLENFYVYALKVMGKTEEQTRDYVELRPNPNDENSESYAEITWKTTPIVSEYVANLRKRITAKYSIQQSDFERTSESYLYYQDLIEMLCSLVRSEIREDHIYYADSGDQVLEDLLDATPVRIKEEHLYYIDPITSDQRDMFIDNPNEAKKIKYIRHILRNIATSTKYIKFQGTQILNSFKPELMSQKIIEVFNIRRRELIPTLMNILNVEDESILEATLVDFFREPTRFTL